jgi:D-beta-D-heptose 7-phosphate kinase / D-beta-D-heptose 1-phosphate adenosyltransferase
LKSTSKIITDLDLFLLDFDRKNKTIVFTNGCFDLLHKGHLHLLNEAKKHGDILIVAVNTDDSVKKLKGNTRPAEPLDIRLKNLSELSIADYLISFSEETPLKIIQKIKPEKLVKGGDYLPENIIGKEYANEVIIIPLLKGFSTTSQIKNIK